MRTKLDSKPSSLRVGVPAMAIISGTFLSGKGNIPYTLYQPRLTIRRRCYDGPFSICHPCIIRYQRQHRTVTPAMDATLSLRPHVYARIMYRDIWALRICLPEQNGLEPQAMVPIPNVGTELTLARALVLKWAWLHVMRSLFPLLGAIIGFVSLLQEML